MDKKILFITWDGPQTSYMEGLFMPIFEAIQKQDSEYEFHILQFTWGDKNRVAKTRIAAEKLSLKYTDSKISRKPHPLVGSIYTLWIGTGIIEKYIHEHKIDIVMPRSNFPAAMVNRIKNKNFKIIFDADGLALEERVDFAGLSSSSLQYKWLKTHETKILLRADGIITRSQKAIDIHIQTIGEEFRNKFAVVVNGRDSNQYRYEPFLREQTREALDIKDEFLFVYAGSLGPQYCLPEMLDIFYKHEQQTRAKLLILTGNVAFAEYNIPKKYASKIILKTVDSNEIPLYLNAADLAFALREPSFSMQGVAPIKLGEYLLCGLPVIASKGIGDTEEILRNFEECYLFDHAVKCSKKLLEISAFVGNALFADKKAISVKALPYFSLEAASKSYIKAIEKML